MFALQNVPLPPLRSSDLSLTPLTLPSKTSKFDLTLFATEVPEGLRLTMEYSTDLFDAATVDRMLARYGFLLEEIVSHPDQPIRALPMLTEEERRLLLEGWNSAGMDLATGLDSRWTATLTSSCTSLPIRRPRSMNSATRSSNGRAPEDSAVASTAGRSRRSGRSSCASIA